MFPGVECPMLCETAPTAFNDPNWIWELKLDGVRCIAELGEKTKLWGRSGADITAKFPELEGIHLQAVKPCVVDGEIVCQSFGQMQQRIHKESPLAIRLAQKQYPATYYVFDILTLAGESVMGKPLWERKKLLEVITCGGNMKVIPYLVRTGVDLFERVRDRGGEGVIGKNINSCYHPGKRSKDWVKVKAFQEGEFYICGITEGENERASTLGSLILAEKPNGKLVYVGNVGSGFTEESLAEVLKALTPLVSECPFTKMPPVNKRVKAWVKPILKCEVRYLEKGVEGHLRFPSFRGIKRETAYDDPLVKAALQMGARIIEGDA